MKGKGRYASMWCDDCGEMVKGNVECMKKHVCVNKEEVKQLDASLIKQISEMVDVQINVKFDEMVNSLIGAFCVIAVIVILGYFLDSVIQHWWNGKMANECYRGCNELRGLGIKNTLNNRPMSIEEFNFSCSEFCWKGRMP